MNWYRVLVTFPRAYIFAMQKWFALCGLCGSVLLVLQELIWDLQCLHTGFYGTWSLEVSGLCSAV